uniref:Uncharacterized protein n=1 Tax=Oryza punctata TaxID=4537 RepID=A0A0E0LTT9_ORYPU
MVCTAQRLREKEVEIDVTHRRATKPEERHLQTAAQSQAWCGSPTATRPSRLDSTPPSTTSSSVPPPPVQATEGFGDFDPLAAAADDA